MLAALKSKGASQQQLRNEQVLKRAEIALTRAIRNAKNAFIGDCASAYESHRERDFHLQLLTHRVAIRQLLAQQAQVIIPRFGRMTLADIHTLAVKGADDSFFSRLVEQWIRERGQPQAAQIATTSLADVIKAVEAGVAALEGTEAIARRIRRVTNLSIWRANTIARTETHGAALFAQASTARQAEQDYGLKLVKTWLPTLDSRTRDAHAAMARHPAIPLDEKFNVGGVMMDRPGDPSAPPALLCNCRCTMVMSEAPE
ncbi:MAG: phage minor head protein [Acetobacteraceae bacterium]